MSRAAKLYIGAVAVAGVISLLYGTWGVPQFDNARLGILALLVVFSGATHAAQMSLFSGSSISVALAVSFVGLLLLGPAGGILANLGCAAVYAVYPSRRAWYKVVFNSGGLMLSAAVASSAYQLAGGVWPPRDITSAVIPAVTAALAYYCVNTVTVSVVISLTTKTDFRNIFNQNHRWLVLHYLLTMAISLMAAYSYQSMGWEALLAFSLLLAMPWAYSRMYVIQTRNVIARNAELVDVNAKLEETNVDLHRRIEQMNAFYSIGLAFNRSKDLYKNLSYIVNSVRELTNAHGVAIYVFSKGTKTLELGAQVGLSDDYMRQPELSLDGPAMRAIKERRRVVVRGEVANSDLFSAAAAKDGIIAAACIPLAVGDEILGALDITFQEFHSFSNDEMTVLETFAEQAAAGIYSAELYQEVHNSYLSTIAALVATVEAKDPYTRGHSESVRDLSIATGVQMGLPQDELRHLELSALFHDIGKIAIPESILGKPSSLTREEWELVKHHPALAENILRHVPTLAETIPIIRAHHERPDGRGYPDGLSGNIPRLSAIISVADAFHAMRSDRPYRQALSKEYAIAQLREGVGSQFDASVVEAFLRAVEPESAPEPPTEPSVPEIRFTWTGALTPVRSMSPQ